ncbi:MAG: hypothetical protein NTU83_06140 [Candidatus Hydrogenedentes bacterium]|nr:hypothetical protein [Candidatus Hydrogenedentota bacterium]
MKYFPVKDGQVDVAVTGDVDGPLKVIREKTVDVTGQIIGALEAGSRYHGYKNPAAKPSLKYTVVDTLEFLEPLPTVRKIYSMSPPMTDYYAIMKRIDIRHWVEDKGVREIWLWGYQGNKVGLFESNMAGPFGDVSNSFWDPFDLPVLKKTYTVYHYNYQRGASEAVEDHMHQIEAVLNWADGRRWTLPGRWSKLLFWGRFVGSDSSNKIVHPGCGWAHYPPNGERDYDWNNPRKVLSDIENWRPDGTGQKQLVGSDRWEGNSLKWFVYWMQNLPGANNGLIDKGKPLRNWWVFIGDFDYAASRKFALSSVSKSGGNR